MKIADLVSTAGILQGFLLGAFILAAHRPGRPTLLLGFFVLTCAARILPFFLIRLPSGQEHPIVLYLPVYFWYLGVPLIYLYARRLTNRLQWGKDWKHLIPGALEFVLLSSLFVMEWAVGGRLFGAATTRGILGVYTIAAIGPAAYYTYLTVRTLEARQAHLVANYSNLDRKQTKWIRNSLYAILGMAMVYTMLRYGPLPVADHVYVLFGSVTNTAIIYYLTYHGVRQLGLDRLLSAGVIARNGKLVAAPAVGPADDDGQNPTFSDIERYLSEQHAYLNPNLTVADVAAGVHCSERTVSRVINNESGAHFNGYINQYRVEKAQQLLLDHHYDHYSMEGIAAEVGFNHKATFYQAFKRETGLSPATYRRKVKQGRGSDPVV